MKRMDLASMADVASVFVALCNVVYMCIMLKLFAIALRDLRANPVVPPNAAEKQ